MRRRAFLADLLAKLHLRKFPDHLAAEKQRDQKCRDRCQSRAKSHVLNYVEPLENVGLAILPVLLEKELV